MIFTKAERDLIFKLAQELVGSKQDPDSQLEILPLNVHKRMMEINESTLEDYLKKVANDENEHDHFISLLTIHTTYWFRELEHFHYLEKYLAESGKNKVIKVWCAACSTGEEAYSVALVLEKFKRSHIGFDYEVYGSDIDSISIEKAKKCIYDKKELRSIPINYQSLLLLGSGKTERFFTLPKEVRERCKFAPLNLLDFSIEANSFDFIICRNVFIYLSIFDQARVFKNFVPCLKDGGNIILGHTENLPSLPNNIFHLERSIYSRKKELISVKKLRHILIVDDEEAILEVYENILSKIENLIVYPVTSCKDASVILSEKKVDLVLLDLNLPGESGDVWIKKIRQSHSSVPVVIISGALRDSSERFRNLTGLGVIDFLDKLSAIQAPSKFREKIEQFISTNSSEINLHSLKNNNKIFKKPEIICIGASTGGTEALLKLLRNFPKNFPPVIVIQHIDSVYAHTFATRLSEVSGLELGDMSGTSCLLQSGKIYMSWGDYHVVVKKNSDGYLQFKKHFATHDEYIYRPSIDCAFTSAAMANIPAISIILTGMGKDGVQGMKAIKDQGGFTMAQNEESCVVFGMPKEAILSEAVSFVGDLTDLRLELEKFVTSFKNESKGDRTGSYVLKKILP
jgi:two-component system, chemotaxis family, protein-glutamate methylesterase/glutaminase